MVSVPVDGSQFLRVVGDRRRWALLSELATSDRRVGELTETVGERQALVSYHLRELRDAGLVSSRRSAFDGRDTYYRLNLDHCRELFRESAAGAAPRAPPRDNLRWPRRERVGRRPRVLFLCTGNSARSQMAAALLDHRSRPCDPGASAGSHPKALHPAAVQVMAHARNRHLRQHHKAPRPLRGKPLRPGDHVVRQGPGGLPRVPR